jgi:hypothetical protein
MQPFLYVVGLLLTFCSASAQNYLTIKVLDEQTQEAVSFALIQNITLEKAFICNEEGYGLIEIHDSTLLKISAISYEHYFHFVLNTNEEDSIKILLKHKTYALKELVVHPYPTRLLFKKAFANLELKDTNAVSPNLFMATNLKGIAEQSKVYAPGDFITLTFDAPVSGIYNLVSRRENSKRKLHKMLWSDTKKAYVERRYNRKYLQQLLAIKEIQKLEEFMEFCQPTYEFILASTDYELACYVLNCYQSFLLNQQE